MKSDYDTPVAFAKMIPPPVYASRDVEKTVAQKRGLRYEELARKWVTERFASEPFGLQYFGEWIEYGLSDGSAKRQCQPDAWFIVGPMTQRRVILFEFKAFHTKSAWYQLKLYSRVIELLYGFPVVSVEMTKSYDPAEPWPERVRLCLTREEFDAELAKVDPRVIVFQQKLKRELAGRSPKSRKAIAA